MLPRIPIEKLHRIEAACNAVANIGEDYQSLIRSLERHYGARIRDRRLRKIVGGGAGPEEIVLEEETP